ncbi:hypothetical protein [Thermomonospora umbrina]|uniref:Uncharacterized protein n=1 Tax=Thermomonospora umbrina TaxID=111806 RepID=A0A3D9SUE9_9ACTN|nr:hypothetical protein [Thermomonospora umbrina]REE99227.1 hypothetical protein DFJ69_4735 [Thermomonospora umbrina]
MQSHTTAQVIHRLGELSAEFAGWRIGHGGSGHWWAVRGNELVRTRDVDELRARLRELSVPRPPGLAGPADAA